MTILVLGTHSEYLAFRSGLSMTERGKAKHAGGPWAFRGLSAKSVSVEIVSIPTWVSDGVIGDIRHVAYLDPFAGKLHLLARRKEIRAGLDGPAVPAGGEDFDARR